MTRSAARRPGSVQVDKSMPPASPTYEDRPDDSHPVPASPMAWYWRFVLFLWGTSFVFLLLYEWLSGLLKSWYKS